MGSVPEQLTIYSYTMDGQLKLQTYRRIYVDKAKERKRVVNQQHLCLLGAKFS